jgi:hypothetical protein
LFRAAGATSLTRQTELIEHMSPKRRGRRPDLFKVLLTGLTVGMTLTLGYQISLYYGAQVQPMAERVPTPSIVDG